MIRIFAAALLVFGLALPFASLTGHAAEMEQGVWRGTIEAENPRAAEPKIETKAALHIAPTGNQLYLDTLAKALAVIKIAANRDGSFTITAGGPPTVELRNVRLSRSDIEALVVYENEAGATLSGRAALDRMSPMSPPSVRPDCGSAPANLAAFCGVWSGISLRGQPKLLIIDKITRNKQKIAWELKARQMWGGDSDLSSAGMSFPYTEYVTDEQLPLTTLPMRTTGKLAYRFELDGDTLTGGHITDAGDRTIYTRVKR